MGRYQLDKWYGLFWIYDVGYGTHHSGSQAGAGRSISSSQMRPGDLIFYTNSGGTINHVALYIGGGRVCHASNARDGIKISTWNYRTPAKIVNVLGD